LKIIFVLNHFLPSQTAGTEVYTWALSKYLQEIGIDVKIIIPNYGYSSDDQYVFDGLSVYKYAEPSIVDRSLIMGFRAPDGLVNFKRFIQVEKPDIVHFHEIAGSNGITLKHVQVAKECGVKVLMTFHLAGYTCKTDTMVYKGLTRCNGIIDLKKCSNCYLHSKGFEKQSTYLTAVSNFFYQSSIDSLKWGNPIGTALGTVSIISKLAENLHLLVDNCDRVVCITSWYKQVLLDNGVASNKICYIPQGLPFQVSEVEFPSKVRKMPLRLLFLGRINKFKGLHLLIKALKSVDPESIELSIYGNSDDSDYESGLRLETAHLKNISWKGKLAQNEVVSTMQDHNMLCLCSTFSEMSPLVIQEAFAAGIPVLASNVYGNAEQIRHNHNGLLFDFNDVDDLRIQLLRCINETSLLEELSKNIKNPRSFKEVGKEYLVLYKSLLN
jgi:glycosyltransferase involved in cell wall biosynthesis